MELAMGIAIGSSTQIALLVIPSLTLAGWALGQDMTLEFPPIEVSLQLYWFAISFFLMRGYLTSFVVCVVCFGGRKDLSFF